MRIKLIYITLITIALASCNSVNENWMNDSQDDAIIHESMSKLTEVIVHDIFSPPAASRNYVYPSIAAYEVARLSDGKQPSLANTLNGLIGLPNVDTSLSYNYYLASNLAFLQTAKKFVFSEEKIDDEITNLLKRYESINMPTDVMKRSTQLATEMSDAIKAYANADNYNQTRSFAKFDVTDAEFEWKPTPPAYMEAIEPHWREIRTFTLDSAQQFRPPFPTEVNLTKGSKFHNELVEVYDAVKNADPEHVEIASFWDCNPFVMNITGHVMHATKKITPGGHWINIAKIVCEKTEADLLKSTQTYAYTAIALADGFISCWDEKYRSNLIRPETLINEHMDPNWIPLLQTPPFPEYTSGHSVISTAAATVLTGLYGDDFSFTDNSEVQYGLPIRKYKSFYDASDEAAISRLYGGIHYRPAIDNGVSQGRKLGEFVVKELGVIEL